MKVADILASLESFAPLGAAASWDNVGLIVGSPAREVTSVLMTQEVTLAVLDEATARGAELVLSYHPPLLRGINKLGPAGPAATLFAAAAQNIAIVTVHTAWDAAAGGVNDVLARATGLVPSACTPLDAGMGRIGTLPAATTLGELAVRTRQALDVPFALVAEAKSQGGLRRVAVAAGAGDDFVAPALAAGAQVLVTGELRHHNLLALLAAGSAAICLTHCGSERASLGALRAALDAALGEGGPALHLSTADVAPLRVV